MRKKVVAGNWKMNLKLDEAIELVESINDRAELKGQLENILIFPPATHIHRIAKIIDKDFIHPGAQNIASEANGAFTGELSGSILKSVGAEYVLIGHSERRIHFGELNKDLMKKVDLALENSIIPVYCCGESLEERQEKVHFQVVGKQVSDALFHLPEKDFSRIILAYEPVWAIGTGETATAEQAEEMHSFIRSLLSEKYGGKLAKTISILYGGSCNPENVHELFGCPNVDGGLIGGASLKANDFLSIIAATYE